MILYEEIHGLGIERVALMDAEKKDKELVLELFKKQVI